MLDTGDSPVTITLFFRLVFAIHFLIYIVEWLFAKTALNRVLGNIVGKMIFGTQTSMLKIAVATE